MLSADVAEFVFRDWQRWARNGSTLMDIRSYHGAGPLYEVLYALKAGLCLAHGYHREDLGLPTAKPLWRYTGDEEITMTRVRNCIRWRGYRCEEDIPDNERPAKDVAPFMQLLAELEGEKVRINLKGLPSGHERNFWFPLQLNREEYIPILTELVDFAWEILDAECRDNASIALRPQTKLRSGKTVDKFCPCGPNCGHLFL